MRTQEALRIRNLRTALVLVVVTLAITGSMFAYRFAHHLKPMPEQSGYGSPFMPAR
jgi:hypothetical protein